MSKRLLLRGGTAAQNDTFTGAAREVTIDTDNWNLRIHDGNTAGGFTVGSLTSLSAHTGNIVPSANLAYNLGNSTSFWNTLRVGNIVAGNINSVTGILTVSGTATVGNLTTAGNITASYFSGNGSQLTGVTAAPSTSVVNGTSNLVVLADANVTVSASGTANVIVVTSTGANVAGYLNVTGNVSAGNLSTAGTASVTGNATVGNLNTAGLITATGNLSSGNLSTSGNLVVSGNATVSGILKSDQTHQVFTTKTAATGVVNHDCSQGQVFIHSSITANFTVNLTNLALDTLRSTRVSLLLNQGSNAYVPTGLQISSVTQTINWQGGSQPAGSALKKNLVNFEVYNNAGTYTVLGELISFG
jgi:cytoskeletal protein CcmA (bactofilin family)